MNIVIFQNLHAFYHYIQQHHTVKHTPTYYTWCMIHAFPACKHDVLTWVPFPAPGGPKSTARMPNPAWPSGFEPEDEVEVEGAMFLYTGSVEVVVDTLQVWQGFLVVALPLAFAGKHTKVSSKKSTKVTFLNKEYYSFAKLTETECTTGFIFTSLLSVRLSFFPGPPCPLCPPFWASLPRDVASLGGGGAGGSVACATALRKLASLKEEGKTRGGALAYKGQRFLLHVCSPHTLSKVHGAGAGRVGKKRQIIIKTADLFKHNSQK